MLKIREFREKKGYSQQELAKYCGVSQRSISAYEVGFREPPIDMLAKIAIILGTTVDELIEFRKIHDEISEDILEMIQNTRKV